MPRQLPLPSTQTKLLSTPLCADLDLRRLLRLFVRWGSTFKDQPLPPGNKRGRYRRIFCYLVTLWSMVLQRLLEDPTLEKVVVCLIHGKADRLRPGQELLSKKIKSKQTVSFSNARQRLPLAWIKGVFVKLPAQLVGPIKKLSWKGGRVILLDGSTLCLAPHGDIPKHFEPHCTQHKGHWCLMRVVVGFCVRTGLALACAVGSQTHSEQFMACGLILAAQSKSLFVGDRNFGIFRIVQTARHARAQVLVRLTQARAFRLLRKKLVSGLDQKIFWGPTHHDQLQPGCSTQPVEGRLIVCQIRRPGMRPIQLILFTTLLDQDLYSVKELVELYGLRWHVELNLRYLKIQMKLGILKCKSAEMAQKEWYAGLIAYNLIRGMMLQAATKALIDPLALSFTSCSREVLETLMEWGKGETIDWTQVLELLKKCQLPNRKKPRPNEPRLVRHRRDKFGPLRGSRAAARKKFKKGTSKC